MIHTLDATKHDWDLAMDRCKHPECRVSREFIVRYGPTYCKARYDATATRGCFDPLATTVWRSVLSAKRTGPP